MKLDCRIKIVVISDSANYALAYIENYVDKITQDLKIEVIGMEGLAMFETYEGINIFWNVWLVLFNNHFNKIAEIFFKDSSYFLILLESPDIEIQDLFKKIKKAYEGSEEKIKQKLIRVMVASSIINKKETLIDRDTGLSINLQPINEEIFLQFTNLIKLNDVDINNLRKNA